MSLLKAYQADPCGTCSIPYWKHKSITMPADMKILHEREFSEVWLRDYTDEPYFRLYHTLEKVEATDLDDYRAETATVSDIPCIVRVINESYTNISVTCEQIMGYTKTEVYQPALWIKAVHAKMERLLAAEWLIWTAKCRKASSNGFKFCRNTGEKRSVKCL